mgnify:CR=1|tara:strand:+ start:70814 stop:70960 length:147 start_codon:yes stop_codon:yes gene_type:complete
MNDDNEIPTFNAAMPPKLTDWEKEPSLRDFAYPNQTQIVNITLTGDFA